MSSQILAITPVLPSANIIRDIAWYEKQTGFRPIFSNDLYAVLQREDFYLHLQWHADTTEDPLLGGSVIRLTVNNIDSYLAEFVRRGTVTPEKIRRNTPWETHEFGFYDLNNNAIFLAEDVR